jgi:short-subunit dehydrogenase
VPPCGDETIYPASGNIQYERVSKETSILITGASSGIGAALAEAYAMPGVRLAIGGRNVGRLAKVAARCRGHGAEVTEAHVDIADPAAVAAWVESADRAAPLDLAIASAGTQGGSWRGSAGETLPEIRRVMEVNFIGVCNTVYPALAVMRPRRRGQIALISSIAGLRGIPFSPAYCASKAALKVYGESLRSWLAPEGISVSVVLPGFVDTPLSQAVSGPKPLMISPERAARIIRRGLTKKRPQIAFPYPLYLGMQLLRAIPPRLADTILRRAKVDVDHRG